MLRTLLTLAALLRADGLPLKTPAAVGMSSERLKAIDRVMHRGVQGGVRRGGRGGGAAGCGGVAARLRSARLVGEQ
jgi:hypothetical protein